MSTRIMLLVALAASSLTLTHCRMVGDRLTGINAGQFGRKDSCVKLCRDEYKAAVKAERDLHRTLLSECRGNQECIAGERARYQAALAALESVYADCVYGCHLQGGGSVGP